MSSIVIHVAPDRVSALVARASGESLQVDDFVSIQVAGTDLVSAEKQLAQALSQHHASKATVVVAMPASSAKWQYLTLPPSPPEDLPALVKLQLDLESSRDDEAVGYDFVPLVSGTDRPQRVLALVLKTPDLAKVHNLGRVSGLKIDHAVPLPTGWIGLAENSEPGGEGIQTFAAFSHREATIWITVDGELAQFRQVQLPDEWHSPSIVSFVAGQLRRSVLNLAQEGIDASGGAIRVWAHPVGPLNDFADSLAQRLHRTVQPTNGLDNVSLPAGIDDNAADLLPLLGIARQIPRKRTVPLDFLHPRKPPAKRSNRRPLILGGIAAALLVSALGWEGYRSLNEPLWAAEELSDDLQQIRQELEPLEAEERDAARIRDWLAASPNVLDELAKVAKDWRPVPPNSSDFSETNDGVLSRLEFNNRRIILAGKVATSASVQPLENRIRDESHRVRRERSEPADDGGQYNWEVQIAVDLLDQTPEVQP